MADLSRRNILSIIVNNYLLLPDMPFLAALAFLSFAAAILLSGHGMPGLHVHAALAVGLLPLMFGAMLHFAPVLTRSSAPHGAVARLPWLVLAAGLAILSAFALPQWFAVARQLGAGLALAAASALLLWMTQRRRAALGPAHPCLDWYRAALVCFVLALLAVPAMALWPQHTLALKRWHLHLNLLGLVGLTALGTLHVLLPTAVAQPDPQAAMRLRQGLPWAFGGTLSIAGGAAWHAELAWLGALLWLVPVVRLALAWASLYGKRLVALHGIPSLFLAALAGLALALVTGAFHGLGAIAPSHAAHALVAGFLLPLVSGAVGQLLALWLRPGVQGAWHETVRAALGRWAGLRAALFGGGGIALLAGWPGGWLLAAAGIVLFLAQLPVVFTTI